MDVYESLFGEQNFSFIAGRIKFLCLNTNAMEYDYSSPIPNFGFMREETQADSGRNESTIVCMHARPGTEGHYPLLGWRKVSNHINSTFAWETI